jgi:hypothetical protein
VVFTLVDRTARACTFEFKSAILCIFSLLVRANVVTHDKYVHSRGAGVVSTLVTTCANLD